MIEINGKKPEGDHDDMFNPFTDVADNDPLFGSIAWAYKSGIVKGTGKTTFDPDGDCSRALFVAVLYKYNQIYKIMD